MPIEGGFRTLPKNFPIPVEDFLRTLPWRAGRPHTLRNCEKPSSIPLVYLYATCRCANLPFRIPNPLVTDFLRTLPWRAGRLHTLHNCEKPSSIPLVYLYATCRCANLPFRIPNPPLKTFLEPSFGGQGGLILFVISGAGAFLETPDTCKSSQSR